MTARLTMPSAMSAETAERLSDVLDWPTPAEQYAQSVEVDRKADELVRSEKWWDETLCGDNEAGRALPGALARIMSNLDSACSGDQIGRDAVTTALSQVQRVARRMARAEVERDEDF